MTTTSERLILKVAGFGARGGFDESEHPRDRLGRFIETGAEVRIWGGASARVLGVVGNGRIEVQRTDNGQKFVVHRNYLTVTKRSDGSAPTTVAADSKPIERVEVDADAVAFTPDGNAVDVDQAQVDALTGGLPDGDAVEVTERVEAYRDAISNGVDDDEADERAALLATLDRVAVDHPDREAEVSAVRDAVTGDPGDAPVAEAAPEGPRRLVDSPVAGESREVGGETFTVGDGVTAPGGRTGEVVGFTRRGGVIVRDSDGNDWPYLPVADVTRTEAPQAGPADDRAQRIAARRAQRVAAAEAAQDALRNWGNLPGGTRIDVDGRTGTVVENLSEDNAAMVTVRWDDAPDADPENYRPPLGVGPVRTGRRASADAPAEPTVADDVPEAESPPADVPPASDAPAPTATPVDLLRARYREIADQPGRNRNAMLRLADAPTLTVTRDGNVAYVKRDRSTWQMFDARTGRSLGPSHRSVWGGKRQADRLAAAYADIGGADSNPWLDAQTSAREWVDGDGRKFTDALTLTRGRLDYQAGRTGTDAAVAFAASLPVVETPRARRLTADEVTSIGGDWNTTEGASPAAREEALAGLQDQMTLLSGKGQYVIHRAAAGEPEWRVTTRGDGRVVIRAKNQSEAITLADAIESAVDADGRPFNAADPGTQARYATGGWRDTFGRSYRQVVEAARASVPTGTVVPDEWVVPVGRRDPVGPRPDVNTDPDRPSYDPPTLLAREMDLDALGVELDARGRVLTAMTEAGMGPEDSDYNDTVDRIGALREARGRAYTAASRELGGSAARWARPRDVGVGDRFVTPDRTTNRPELVTVTEAGGGAVVVRRADGSTEQINDLDGFPGVLTVPGDVREDPTGSVLVADGVSRQQAEANLRDMFTYTHEGSGFRTDLADVTVGRDESTVSGTVKDANGVRVGSFQRTVKRHADGRVEAHHDLLKIRPQYQGQGFADAYYKHLYAQYESRGVTEVTINANIDVGGYAWAQRGFGWASGDMSPFTRESLFANLQEMRADRRDNLTPEQMGKLDAFMDLLNTPAGLKLSPKDVANSLRDITWTETRRGKEITMWPGKAALLGMSWDGRFLVQARTEGDDTSVPDVDVTTMPGDALTAEADALLSRINPATDSGDTDLADRLVARLDTIRVEQRRRYTVAAAAVAGPGREDVTLDDVTAGDSIVLPYLLARPGEAETPAVVRVTTVGPADDATSTRPVTVEYPDGTTRVVVFSRFTGSTVTRSERARTTPGAVETVAWARVQAGDTVIVDALDGYGQAPVSVASIERDGDTLSLSVVHGDGTVVDMDVARDGVVSRVTGAPAPVVETPTPPADLDDDAIRDELTRLMRRMLGTYPSGDPTAAVRDRRRADALLAEQRNRSADPLPDTPARPPAPARVAIGPLGAEEGVSRPVLYTYQRRNVVALDLDSLDAGSSPVAKQAAARVRARQPLTAGQSQALADHLRGLAADPGGGVRRQRMLTRLAGSFDAAAAHVNGRGLDVPTGQGVTRGLPAGLLAGDSIAIPGRGGTAETVRVVDARAMMGGRVHRVTVERDDGTTETRFMHRDQGLFILPTLPPDQPVTVPPREYVAADQVQVGDTVRVMRGGQLIDLTVSRISETYGREWYAEDPPNTGFSYGEDRVYLRVARGDASRDQAAGVELPPDGTPVPVQRDSIAVGDRVTATSQIALGVSGYGAIPATGTVLSSTQVDGPDGSLGRSFTILDDSGAEVTVTVFGDTVERLASAGDNIVGAIAVLRRDSAKRAVIKRAVEGATSIQKREIQSRIDRARLGVGNGRAAVLSELAADGGRVGFISSERALAALLADVRGVRVTDGEVDGDVTSVRVALAADARQNIIDAVTAATPLSGETEQQMLTRVLDQYETAPPVRHMGRVVASLMVDVGAAPDDPPEVDVPEGGDLRTRMDAFRARIGSRFGHTSVRRPSYGDLDVAALEAGEAPEVVWRDTFTRPRAADGGPAAVAMEHLDVVRAAGREIAAQVADVSERIYDDVLAEAGVDYPRLPGESPDAYQARVDSAVDAVDARRRALSEQTWEPGADRARFLQQRADLHAEMTRLRQTQATLTKVAGEVRRRATIEVLSQIRDIGGHRLDYEPGDAIPGGRGRRASVRAATRADFRLATSGMRQAEDVLPTDWVESIRGYVGRTRRGSESIPLNISGRGGAYSTGRITLSDRPSEDRTVSGSGVTAVAVHELTHFAERAVPGLVAAEEAYLWARTSTGTGENRVREARVNMAAHRGDSSQFGYVDEFPIGYTGVDYVSSRQGGEEAYEVLTTGIESVFGGSPYTDDDFQQFMLGALALLGDARPPRANAERLPVPEDTPTPRRRATPRATGAAPQRRSRDVARVRELRRAPSQGIRGADADESVRADLEASFGYTHEGSGFRTQMRARESYIYRDGARFKGDVVDGDGNKVGTVTRSIKYHPNGRVEVHHDFLKIDPEHQGQGFADAYYKHLYAQYEQMGVTEVTIDANIDVGGYAWAQRGFGWASGRPTATMVGGMARRLRALARRDDLSAAQKAEIEALSERIRGMRTGGPVLSPKDIANASRHITWTETRDGKEITMWPGKAAMLGSRWNGKFATGVRRRPPTPLT